MTTKDLIPAKKGEVRNPNGRPKGALNIKKRLELLLQAIRNDKDINPVTGEPITEMDKMLVKAIEEAQNGSVAHLREILDRIEGKPKQTAEIEHTGQIEQQHKITFEIIDPQRRKLVESTDFEEIDVSDT